MNDSNAREHIQAHADAVVRGDFDAVVADFTEELRPQVPQIAQLLPQPVESAEVVGVEVGDEAAVALIRYSGAGKDVTIRTRWQERDGRPLIVHGEPA
jgi:hypothetical protein